MIEQNIHNTKLYVKPIPDPREDTKLDPRAYERRKLEAESDNPLAGYEEVPVDLVRQQPAAPSIDLVGDEVTMESRTIETRNGETMIHIMKPLGSTDKSDGRPILLFIHGGAFIMGSTEYTVPFCKQVAKEADAIVIGVDYRLSPEHHFPVALHDCYDAFDWICKHATELGGNPNKVSVGGDSAGGTLAIGVTMMEQQAYEAQAVDRNRVCSQALVYPAVLVDNVRMPDYRWRFSEYEVADDDVLAAGAAFSLAAMTGQMAMLYMGESGPITNPLAAPLCAENLSYLPKTLVTLCELDYLRLQGEAFVRKLEREGVEHTAILYQGMDHGYIDGFGYCPQAYDTAIEVANRIKE